MSKHTPGPWEWRDNVLFTLSQEFLDNFVMCPKIVRAPDGNWSPSVICDPADRALIAAAPDMLAVCEKTIEALNDLAIEGLLRIGVHYTIDDAAMCARAAIAKAKGETK